MTLIERKHKNDNYYITVGVESRCGGCCYIVQVCPLMEDNYCGYPIRNMIYAMSEKKKAYATFSRYKRKYI